MNKCYIKMSNEVLSDIATCMLKLLCGFYVIRVT